MWITLLQYTSYALMGPHSISSIYISYLSHQLDGGLIERFLLPCFEMYICFVFEGTSHKTQVGKSDWLINPHFSFLSSSPLKRHDYTCSFYAIFNCSKAREKYWAIFSFTKYLVLFLFFIRFLIIK